MMMNKNRYYLFCQNSTMINFFVFMKRNVHNLNYRHKLLFIREFSLSLKEARLIRANYLKIRSNNVFHTFSPLECFKIRDAYAILGQTPNYKHSLVDFKPLTLLEDKGLSDELAVSLWNDVLPYHYNAEHISNIKEQAESFIQNMDLKKPLGIGFTDIENIQYITAHSSSSFLGIQRASSSSFALQSMINTLESHSSKSTVNRDWLLPNLEFIHNHLITNKDIMNKHYGELVLHAKTSSASISGYDSYRDFIFQNSLDMILDHSIRYEDNKVPYLMYTGVRNSNRGKYRLIFSMSAYFRALDYLINNGSYDLCTHDGLLSSYTTEGLSNKDMWNQMCKMTDRSGLVMLCCDFKGYDTQISISDYIAISLLLNKHRLTDPKFSKMFYWYYSWLLQPKPLLTRVDDSSNIQAHRWVLEYQNKLASGLHGTHSFENLYGVATTLQMQKLGIDVRSSWFNGDDQNFLISDSHLSDAINWLQSQFTISWDKSLMGHNLTVWGKQWFSKDIHPVWEVGTFRSIFEREGGSVGVVEESKFCSNYCKILQVAITLIRLGKGPEFTQRWIDLLCSYVSPRIDSSRIPYSLESLNISSESTNLSLPKPFGLEYSNEYLKMKTFNILLFNTYDINSMLSSLYYKRIFYSKEPKDVSYYPKDTSFSISRSVDYSIDEAEGIPWMYKDLIRTSFSNNDLFVRSVLQGTKSYDGVSDIDYRFHDMLSLAYAINNRNRDVWNLKLRSQ